MEVGRGLRGDGVGRGVAEVGEKGSGFGYKRGFVGLLTAAGLRDEERGVGFYQEAIGGCGLRDLLESGAFGVGEIAGEGEVKAGSEGLLGHALVTGKAVHDAGEAGRRPVLGDEVEQIGSGVAVTKAGFDLVAGEFGGAAVDGDGLARAGGDVHLGDEGGLLNLGVGVVEVVVIEADLANGDAAGVAGEGCELGEGVGGGLVRLLRVNAGGREELQGGSGVGVREFEGAVHRGGAVADADGEQGPEAGVAGAVEDGGQVGVVVEVAVGVDEHGFRVSFPAEALMREDGLNRREFGAALAAMAMAGVAGSAGAQTVGDAEMAGSRVYKFAEMKVTPNSNGGWSRAIVHGTLPTGEFIEAHETMLPQGQQPHPPHRHRNTEFILLREGQLEYLNEGAPEAVVPGDVIFTASNRLHGLKNTGTLPALYYVISISHGQM